MKRLEMKIGHEFAQSGGAAAIITLVRETLEGEDADAVEERVTHFRQVVSERTGTEG